MHSFRSMGCEVVVALDDDAPAGALEAIRALFEARDARFTRFARDSELLRVNAAGARRFVSPEFARALRAALAAAHATGGLVDPTLLDALEKAGYDRDIGDMGDDRGPVVRGAGGRWHELELKGRLFAHPPGLRVDLNGVVKAMAVDDALAAIDGRGWISAGGDLASGRPLEVGLPHGGAVRLESGALATSGTAVRRWTRAGREQHHLIDPRTGRPAESPWEHVTACGTTCWAADVAAKAAFLLGHDGPGWLEQHGMPGRFVTVDGEVVVTAGWHGGVAACI